MFLPYPDLLYVKFPCDSLADIFGFRQLLLLGLWASAPFLYLFTNSWPQLLWVCFYYGLSTGLYAPTDAEAARFYL